MQTFRIFISSPGDAAIERERAEIVIGRLNGEFAGLAHLEAIRWESEYYKAHTTFQTQIPPAAECDVVVGILKWRLGTPLPPDFPEATEGGEPYASGTAYEILTAIEQRRKGSELPDVFVFRYTGTSPRPELDDPNRVAIEREWSRLRDFIARWFVTQDGRFTAAFNPYRSEDDFEEHFERLLRKWCTQKIAGGRTLRWPESKGSPFRGLDFFGSRHASVFFGRAADIRRAIETLRAAASRGNPFLLLVGASGAGKSSLARAGLLPRLTTPGVIPSVDRWRVAAMRPGDSQAGPFMSLAVALLQREEELPLEEQGRGPALPEIAEGDYRTPADLADLFSQAPSSAVNVIVNALRRISERSGAQQRYDRPIRCDLVLLIDQLDELFGSAVSDGQRDHFAAVMTALQATGRVWIITTLRANLYEAFLQVPGLKVSKDAGASYDLASPGAAELAEIVRGPAEAAGIVYERDAATGESLDERLLRDASSPDMLPLVQLALTRLYEARQSVGPDIRLPFSAYQSFGGLSGMIDTAGERALAGLTDAARERLPALIRQLAEHSQSATLNAASVSARAVPLAAIVPDEASRQLVDALVASRLLTLSGEGPAAVLRLAHQRVLSDWSRAKQIVSDSSEFYRIRDEVEEQQRRWNAGGHRRELLLARGLPLAEAQSMLTKYGSEVSPQTLAFVSASRRNANRRQVLAWSVASLFAVLAAGSSVAAKIAYDQSQRALAETQRAESEKAAADRNFALAKQTVDSLIFDVAQGLRNIAGMRVETIRTLLNTVRATVDQLAAGAPDNIGILESRLAMLSNFSVTYLAAGDVANALAAATEQLELARKLLASAPNDPAAERDVALALQNIGNGKVQAGDIPGAMEALKESYAISRKLAAAAPNSDAAQYGLYISMTTLGDLLQMQEDPKGALTLFEDALTVARKLLEAAPDKPAYRRAVPGALGRISSVKLVLSTLSSPTYEEDRQQAISTFMEVVKMSREVVTAQPGDMSVRRDLAIALGKLADVQLEISDFAGAVRSRQEAVDVARAIAASDPGNADHQVDVARSLADLGEAKSRNADSAGAMQAVEDSLDLLVKLSVAFPANAQVAREVVVAWGKLGDAKRRALDTAGAAAAYQNSLDVARRLADQDPSNAQAQDDVGVSGRRLSTMQSSLGDMPGAIAALQVVIDVRTRFATANPGSIKAKNDLAFALASLAQATRDAGQHARAAAIYGQELAVRREIAAHPERTSEAVRDIGFALSSIGDEKLEADDRDGALAAYSESLEMRRSVVKQFPDERNVQDDVWRGLDKLARYWERTGQLQQALKVYQESLAYMRELSAGRNEPFIWIPGALANIGRVQLALGNMAEGVAAYQAIVDIYRSERTNASDDRPIGTGGALSDLGDAQKRAGDLSAAIASYRESLEVRRRVITQLPSQQIINGYEYNDLVNILLKLGEALVEARQPRDEALSLFRESYGIGLNRLAIPDAEKTHLMRDLHEALVEAFWSLMNMGRPSEALAEVSKPELAPGALKLDFETGVARIFLNQPDAAITDLKAALRAAPESIYVALMVQVAHLRGGKESIRDNATAVSPLLQGPWPAPILAFYLGETSEEQVRAAAMAVADPKIRAERTCELNYYLGEDALHAGRRQDAETMFRSAVQECHPRFIEASLARLAIDQLAASRP